MTLASQKSGRAGVSLARLFWALWIATGFVAEPVAAQEDAADTEMAAAQDPGDVAPAPGLPTPNEIIAEVDAGIALLRQGKQDAAYEILDRVNTITFENDYPALANHFPNVGLAFYNHATGNWSEVLRFAASVSTGLSADGFDDHAYRLSASVLQGVALRRLDRIQEAETVLRNAVAATRDRPDLVGVYGMALYHLAMLANEADRADQDALMRQFLNEWSSDWLVTPEEGLLLNFRDIVHDMSTGNDLARAIRRTRNLVRATESTEGVDLRRLAAFRGYLGLLSAQQGDFDAARTLLRQEYDYYREAGVGGIDLNEAILSLGLVLRYGTGNAEAVEFLADEVILARQSGTSPRYIARFLMDQGDATAAMGQQDQAQALYREAYGEVRRVERSNHQIALSVRGKIDVDHPGMQGFAFAPELGAIDAVDFSLSVDGSDVIRLFFEGNYLALEALLDRYAAEGKGESVSYLINKALYLGVIGKYDECLDILGEARRRAGTTHGPSVPANAIIFDQIEVIAKVWGTGHEPETASSALRRMRARLPTMNPSERGLYHALKGFQELRIGDDAAVRATLQNWFDEYDPDRAPGVWDIFTATVIMEMSFGTMDAALNEKLMADTLQKLEAFPGMSLSRDYLRLVKVMNSREGLLSNEALVELGTLVSTIGSVVPRDHSFIFTTQHSLAMAHEWRGNYEDAIFWMRETVETLRQSPYHRRDDVAYMQGQMSTYLRVLERADEALALADEALKAIDPRSALPDVIGFLYQAKALALRDRTDNYELVNAFIEEVMADTEVFDRVPPLQRAILLRIRADILSNYAELPEVLAALDLAEAEMDAPHIDWRLEQSSVAWSRAIANYWNGVPGEGFTAMVRSNDIYVDWLTAVQKSAGAQGIDPGAYKERADWEALIGWDYAQTLPPSPVP